MAARVLETVGADPQKIRSQVNPAGGSTPYLLQAGPVLVERGATILQVCQYASMLGFNASPFLPTPARSVDQASGGGCRCAPVHLPVCLTARLLSCMCIDTRGSGQVIRMVGESQETVGVGGGSGPSSNKTPTLEEYGNNLTQQAREVLHAAGLSASACVCRHTSPVPCEAALHSVRVVCDALRLPQPAMPSWLLWGLRCSELAASGPQLPCGAGISQPELSFGAEIVLKWCWLVV